MAVHAARHGPPGVPLLLDVSRELARPSSRHPTAPGTAGEVMEGQQYGQEIPCPRPLIARHSRTGTRPAAAWIQPPWHARLRIPSKTCQSAWCPQAPHRFGLKLRPRCHAG